jgi:hypothetical protein
VSDGIQLSGHVLSELKRLPLPLFFQCYMHQLVRIFRIQFTPYFQLSGHV